MLVFAQKSASIFVQNAKSIGKMTKVNAEISKNFYLTYKNAQKSCGFCAFFLLDIHFAQKVFHLLKIFVHFDGSLTHGAHRDL